MTTSLHPPGVADVEKKPEYAFGEFGGRYIPETLMEAHEVGAYTHRCIHTKMHHAHVAETPMEAHEVRPFYFLFSLLHIPETLTGSH